MEFKLNEYHRNVSIEELLADVKHVAKELSVKTLSIRQYRSIGRYDYMTFKTKFNGWSDVLSQAGLEIHNPNNIKSSFEDLMKNLEEVWIKLGRQPTCNDLTKANSRYSFGPYIRQFGTWRTALETFVEYINNEDNFEQITEVLPTDGHRTKRSINLRIRFLVMQRDDFKCRICGRSPATTPGLVLHIDHIKPWAKGGETIMENLQTLCQDCNLGKSDIYDE